MISLSEFVHNHNIVIYTDTADEAAELFRILKDKFPETEPFRHSAGEWREYRAYRVNEDGILKYGLVSEYRRNGQEIFNFKELIIDDISLEESEMSLSYLFA